LSNPTGSNIIPGFHFAVFTGSGKIIFNGFCLMDRIILLDFDGVLADTADLMLRFSAEVCAELGHPCTPTRTDLAALRPMSFPSLGRQLGLPEILIEAFVEGCLARFRQHPEPLPVFSGMPQAVSRLAQEARIGIVTGNGAAAVRRTLEQHGLERHIDLVLGEEDPRPRLEKLRAVMNALGQPGDAYFMVGDAVSDVTNARAIGATSIAVAWGHQNPADLRSAGADFLVETPEQLVAAILSI
jgi:phosphoglycolate phosphatase-like HAD superfamily hydrolase